MKFLRFEIKPGEEIVTTLQNQVAIHGIKNGAIISIIGAVDECRFSTMPKNDPQENIMHVLKQPLELSGTGEIEKGKVHLHCFFAKDDGNAIGGHLHYGKVSSWFVHVYVLTEN